MCPLPPAQADRVKKPNEQKTIRAFLRHGVKLKSRHQDVKHNIRTAAMRDLPFQYKNNSRAHSLKLKSLKQQHGPFK